jgi:rubrerythrin
MGNPADTRDPLRVLRQSWRHEVEAAATYRLLAEQERDPRHREILRKLLEAEETHAARWAGRIRDLGGTVPDASTAGSTG